MATPANKKLYEQVKNEIYKKNPIHSAYRSSLLVKTYKERGGTYLGKKNDNTGLTKWHKEKWTNQDGETGYKSKSDVYRPTVKVNDKTPTTFNELTKNKLRKQEKRKQEQAELKSLISNPPME